MRKLFLVPFVRAIAGFLIYRPLMHRLDQMRDRGGGKTTSGYIFATIFAGYQIYLLRGSLMPAIAYLSPVIPLVLLCTTHAVRARGPAIDKEKHIVT